MMPSLVRVVIKAMQEWLLSERIANFDFSALCTTSTTRMTVYVYTSYFVYLHSLGGLQNKSFTSILSRPGLVDKHKKK